MSRDFKQNKNEIMKCNKNILCVCTETHTGMRDFALPLIRAAAMKFEVYSLFVVNPNRFSDLRKMIDNEHSIVSEQSRSKCVKILNRLYSFQLKQEIDRICKEKKIKTIWLMTGDAMAAPLLGHLQRKYEIYYTVHDLFPHYNPYKTFWQRIVYNFMFQRHFDKLLRKCTNLITSSRAQYDYIVKNMPEKKAFYHPFPSLVNNTLIPKKCPELEGVKDYILFFAAIAPYKGIDYLYKAFISSSKLQKFKLVIAGYGNLWFEREMQKEQNVIFVNRYLKDEEIPKLVEDSKAVVLPYRTATQSGNVSYVYYYNKLLLLSDIPYFREVAKDGKTALFFKSEDVVSLREQLERLLFETNEIDMKENQRIEYSKSYSEEGLSEYIKLIFEKLD